MRLTFVFLLLLAAVSAASPAFATSSYAYKKGEYRVIRDGLAHNRRLSVSARGEGEDGNQNFHLYLMAEPAHRRIVQLPSVGADDILDSAADAFWAAWSADSRHVAVTFRKERHVTSLRLYEIQNGHAKLMDSPDPFGEIIKPAAVPSDDFDLRSGYSVIVWRSPTRFLLKQRHLYDASSHALSRALGAFGRTTANESTHSTDSEGKPVEWLFVDFSVEAVCEIARGGTVRIVDMKPGGFGDDRKP